MMVAVGFFHNQEIQGNTIPNRNAAFSSILPMALAKTFVQGGVRECDPMQYCLQQPPNAAPQWLLFLGMYQPLTHSFSMFLFSLLWSSSEWGQTW